MADHILRIRKAARLHFAGRGIAEPAWNMMLALYAADAPKGLSKARVGARAQLTQTTALRWLRFLEREGYVGLVRDREDKRVVRVQLTTSGLDAIRKAFLTARYVGR